MTVAADDRFATLARSARETAKGMAAATEGHPDTARVSVAAGQFRLIATMLAQLADDAARCSANGCMGRPIDGFRFWVPHEQFARVAAEVAELRKLDMFNDTSLFSVPPLGERITFDGVHHQSQF